VSSRKPRLAFVSTVFLQPEDAGGKIRSSNVLRGLKGGAFETTLVSPGTTAQVTQWAPELARLADHFVPWTPQDHQPRWMRAFDLMGRVPVNVAHGVTREARATVERVLAEGGFDVAVFDFVHATELMPVALNAASVCFTHNVETEIFERHAQNTRGSAMGWVWASQAGKMRRYERQALQRYSSVIAVSDRDARQFTKDFDLGEVAVIPTAVDLDFFSWSEPLAEPASARPTVVFTGSMDWMANVDGVEYFLGEVWPLVLAQLPEARFVVVGRNPPAALVRQARASNGVEFTGFVDDVRPHVRQAQAFVIPLRVGGGTRIKAFEAMAMGCPVVSTAIGIEGLDVEPDRHFLLRDSAQAMAQGVIELLTDAPLRVSLSTAARQVVEQRFGHMAAAQVFERICLKAMAGRSAGARPELSLA
jgi:glycosyltransferase involved in cell wall biosynthesis